MLTSIEHGAGIALMVLAVAGLFRIISGCGIRDALESRARALADFLDG